jgi:DNA-directed RNA polymerase subunit RPC12/RpoP
MIKEYKCPNCAGAVKFDSSSQKMKCPYCDTEFEIEALEEYQKELAAPTAEKFSWDTDSEAKEWETAELDCLTTGSCPSCGAELMGDQNTAAMVCPNCGNSQIVKQRLEGMLKPNYVIPFKLEKKSAVEALKKFYLKKRLLPNCFKQENNIESIQGAYFPFWLFDAKADAHICYKATRTRVWSDSNYTYSKTDYYSVVRDGSLSFEKIPVDGSVKMDDAHMDSIEPFDYSEKKDFNTAFLAGYIAEKYDVDAETCKDRANFRIKNSIENEFRKSVKGYNSVRVESSQVGIEGGKVNYALFPVWVLNTKYKNENFQFLMNGQTGLLAGRLPVDNGKVWKYHFMFTGIIGAALTLIIQALRIFF